MDSLLVILTSQSCIDAKKEPEASGRDPNTFQQQFDTGADIAFHIYQAAIVNPQQHGTFVDCARRDGHFLGVHLAKFT